MRYLRSIWLISLVVTTASACRSTSSETDAGLLDAESVAHAPVAPANGTAYECKPVVADAVTTTACFPMGHVCMDPHGIGDGNPIPTDCWTGGNRACHNGSANWPACAGGVLANECKKVDVAGEETNVCFPAGHVCMDPHGIGDGNPIPTDCWTGGSRACHNGAANWPACAGGVACQNGSTNAACAESRVFNECKMVDVGGEDAKVCFPLGHVCRDPHGIGDGNPIVTDCWTGGSRACHNGAANWPTCAGGVLID